MATFELSNLILGMKRVLAATLELFPSTPLAVRVFIHALGSVTNRPCIATLRQRVWGFWFTIDAAYISSPF